MAILNGGKLYDYWIPDTVGLALWKGDMASTPYTPVINRPYFKSICTDSQGNLWALAGTELIKIEGGRTTTRVNVGGPGWLDLYSAKITCGPDGSLWVASGYRVVRVQDNVVKESWNTYPVVIGDICTSGHPSFPQLVVSGVITISNKNRAAIYSMTPGSPNITVIDTNSGWYTGVGGDGFIYLHVSNAGVIVWAFMTDTTTYLMLGRYYNGTVTYTPSGVDCNWIYGIAGSPGDPTKLYIAHSGGVLVGPHDNFTAASQFIASGCSAVPTTSILGTPSGDYWTFKNDGCVWVYGPSTSWVDTKVTTGGFRMCNGPSDVYVNSRSGTTLAKINKQNRSVTSILAPNQAFSTCVDRKNSQYTSFSSGCIVKTKNENILAFSNIDGAIFKGICLDASGNVWSADSANNRVIQLSPSGELLSIIAVGSSPTGVCCDLNGYIWVTNTGDNTISKVDVPSKRAIKTIPVGLSPYGICCDLNNIIWVTNSASGTVSKVSNDTVEKTISTESTPLGICMYYDGSYIIVNHGNPAGTSHIGKIIGDVYSTVYAYAAGMLTYGIAANRLGYNIAGGKNGTSTSVYTCNTGGAAISGASFAPCLGDSTGMQWFLLFEPTGPQKDIIWLADRLHNTLVKYSYKKDRIVGEVGVGLSPQGVCVDGNNIVWVLNYTSKSISKVVDSVDGITEVAVISLPYAPAGMVVDRYNNVWVLTSSSMLYQISGTQIVGSLSVTNGTYLTTDLNGAVWVASSSRCVYKIVNGSIQKTIPINGAAMYGMTCDKTNTIWLSYVDDALSYATIKIKNDVLQTPKPSPTASPLTLSDGATLSDGTIWVGGHSGGYIAKTINNSGDPEFVKFTPFSFSTDLPAITSGYAAGMASFGDDSLVIIPGAASDTKCVGFITEGTWVSASTAREFLAYLNSSGGDPTGMKWKNLFGDLQKRAIPFVV